jgi:hypothetical protein
MEIVSPGNHWWIFHLYVGLLDGNHYDLQYLYLLANQFSPTAMAATASADRAETSVPADRFPQVRQMEIPPIPRIVNGSKKKVIYEISPFINLVGGLEHFFPDIGNNNPN